MIPKFAIVGPESTGKSTLATALAAHFKVPVVDEYAREYIDLLEREYFQSDLLEISLGQLRNEAEVLRGHPQVLICDTNLLVIKVWSEFKYGNTDPALLKLMQLDTYTHYLLTDIDIAWTFDPQREHPEKRQELFTIYHKELKSRQLPFTIVSGNHEKRLQTSLSKINEIILAK